MTGPAQISGGAYPLIQQPNPLQQLASVIQAIKAQQQERQMTALHQQLLQGQVNQLPAQSAALQAEIDLRRAEAAHNSSLDAEQRRATGERVKAATEATDRAHALEAALGPLQGAFRAGADMRSPEVAALFQRGYGTLPDSAARDSFHAAFEQMAGMGEEAAQKAQEAANKRRAEAWAQAHPGDAGVVASGSGAVQLTTNQRDIASRERIAAARLAAEQAKEARGATTPAALFAPGQARQALVYARRLHTMVVQATAPGGNMEDVTTPVFSAILSRLAKVPVIGGAVGGAADAEAQANMTPTQRAMYQSGMGYITAMAGGRAGSRAISTPLLMQLAQTYLPAAGINDAATHQMFDAARLDAASRLVRSYTPGTDPTDTNDIPHFDEDGNVVGGGAQQPPPPATLTPGRVTIPTPSPSALQFAVPQRPGFQVVPRGN